MPCLTGRSGVLIVTTSVGLPVLLALAVAWRPAEGIAGSSGLDDSALFQSSVFVSRVAAHDQSARLAADKVHVDVNRSHQEPVVDVNVTAPVSAAEATGVSSNQAGDLSAFISALVMYTIMTCGCMGVFMFLRTRFPLIYSHNITLGIAPELPEGSFGWAKAALGTPTEQSADMIGMDNAMLLEFTNLCMKILAIIGIPMFCIMGPLNWAFGGLAAGDDYLSYLSFGNVEFGNWLYYIYPFVVWGVVITVQVNIYGAQKKFLARRYKWLKSLPEPRCTTVLVEGIPEEYRSDEKLADFFSEMFARDRIKKAYVVKDTGRLPKLKDMIDASQMDEDRRQMEGENDPTLTAKHQELVTEFKELKTKINDESKEVGGVNLHNGFVTFHERRDAELAKMVQYSPDHYEWVVSTPPGPTSVLWGDLTQDAQAADARNFIGYAAVVALYLTYLPCVLGITNIAMKVDLGPLQPVWAGVAPTVGLQFMVAFLPTFLLIIFRIFFTLKDDRWAQQRLQNWYFVFQVVFVILVTAVGRNIWETSKEICEDPFKVFSLLADTMPGATHFYMNFLVLQWYTHAMNLTRYVTLMKFLGFSRIWEEEDARQLAEPEDQDYYGTGSRSARFTINMLIGIIFGTLSPPVNVLAFVNFFVCRLFYGYLIVFAETKKPDLGGVFWVHQLKHLFIGNMIYCILMTGVLYRRAETSTPAIISAFSFFYVCWSFNRFDTAFSWEKLPYTEIVRCEGSKLKDGETYTQHELVESQANRRRSVKAA